MKKNFDLHDTDFGIMFDIHHMPKDADIIIVCYNKGCLKPLRLMLPHQLYFKEFQKIVEDYDPTQITIVPVNSKDYIDLFPDQLSSEPLKNLDWSKETFSKRIEVPVQTLFDKAVHND